MDGRQFLFQLFHCPVCTASDSYYSTETLFYHVTVCILWWLLDGKDVYFYINNKLSTSTTTVNLSAV